jgi:hypothetical protein
VEFSWAGDGGSHIGELAVRPAPSEPKHTNTRDSESMERDFVTTSNRDCWYCSLGLHLRCLLTLSAGDCIEKVRANQNLAAEFF